MKASHGSKNNIRNYESIYFFHFCVINFLSKLTSPIDKTLSKELTDWKQVSEWSFNGKMAIKDNNNNGSGRVSWSHTKETTHVVFKAPLGQGNWKLTETNQIL